MKLENLTVWIVSPEAWGEQRVSKHHYALELVRRGNEVIFIEPARGDLWKPRTVQELLTAIPIKPIPGMRFLPRWLQQELTVFDLQRIARATGSRPDIIWSFDNSRLFALDRWKEHVRIIHHVVDLSMQYHRDELAECADLCLATTNYIAEQLKKVNPNSHAIGHGVALWDSRQNYGLTRRKRVVYAGNLLIKYLNRELILKAIDQFKEVDFVFVGSYAEGNMNARVDLHDEDFIQQLTSRSNCKLLGPKIGAEYYKVLDEADVFIIAYHSAYYEQVANPHKVLEFLYTGRPIVSNILGEYKHLDLLHMSDDEQVWLSMLEHALADTQSDKKAEERRNFAVRHTYAQQVNFIEELLHG
jgi:hypothetical protein